MAEEFLEPKLGLGIKRDYAMWYPGSINSKGVIEIRDEDNDILDKIVQSKEYVKMMTLGSIKVDLYVLEASHVHRHTTTQNAYVTVFRDLGESTREYGVKYLAGYLKEMKDVFAKYPDQGFENVLTEKTTYDDSLPRAVKLFGLEMELQPRTFSEYDTKGIGSNNIHNMNAMAKLENPFSENIPFLSYELQR